MSAYWPGGVRHGGGASLFCGFCTELGKACDDIAAMEVAAKGKVSSGGNREALSTVAAHAGGPARSSNETSVMEAERRGRLIWMLFARATRESSSLGGDE